MGGRDGVVVGGCFAGVGGADKQPSTTRETAFLGGCSLFLIIGRVGGGLGRGNFIFG